MAIRRWAGRGWGAAKDSTAKRGNFAVGCAIGSGHQNQIHRMTSPQRTALANEMVAAGITWVRMDAEWWTIQKNGGSLSTALTSGQSYTSITVRPTAAIMSFVPGDEITLSDLAGGIQTLTVTAPATTSASVATVISVATFTASQDFAALNTKYGQAWDWSTVDGIVEDFRAAGLHIVMLLNKASGWCQRPANTAPLFSQFTSPDPKLFGVFCAAAVEHFWSMGVHVYELWNEANLSSGTGADGWAYVSPLGLAELSVEAYAAIKAQNANAYVLSGSLATQTEFGTAGTLKTASWSSVTAGATTVTIASASASASDAPGFLYDPTNQWPVGTVVRTATAGVGYTVIPPPWSSGGFPAIAASPGTQLRFSDTKIAPDYFLARYYEACDGAPSFDALAIHPYTQPVKPGEQLAIFGGWAVIPNMRQIMIDNGDATKPMWMTEVGAPTGTITAASWPSALSSATSLVISSTQAKAADVQYGVTATGLPANAWVDTVNVANSWTVRPSTGATLSTALLEGVAVTQITVSATPTALDIPSGTTLRLVLGSASNIWATVPFVVTTTATVTTSTSSTTVIPVTEATPGFPVPTGTKVQALLGQSFGTAISASSSAAVNLVPPGVPTVFGQVDESTQQAIIAAVFTAVARGLPSAGTGPGSPPMAYVGPIFLYCWIDSNAGAFGLVRGDGVTAKPALAAATLAIRRGY